jgi:acyl-coenzyme A thioesterase PaaI-like protein
LISAHADNAMGIACVAASAGQGGGAVTVQLSVDFIGSIDLGQWLEVAAVPTKLGRTLAFAEARITADDEIVARATAVFRMLG